MRKYRPQGKEGVVGDAEEERKFIRKLSNASTYKKVPAIDVEPVYEQQPNTTIQLSDEEKSTASALTNSNKSVVLPYFLQDKKAAIIPKEKCSIQFFMTYSKTDNSILLSFQYLFGVIDTKSIANPYVHLSITLLPKKKLKKTTTFDMVRADGTVDLQKYVFRFENLLQCATFPSIIKRDNDQRFSLPVDYASITAIQFVCFLFLFRSTRSNQQTYLLVSSIFSPYLTNERPSTVTLSPYSMSRSAFLTASSKSSARIMRSDFLLSFLSNKTIVHSYSPRSNRLDVRETRLFLRPSQFDVLIPKIRRDIFSPILWGVGTLILYHYCI